MPSRISTAREIAYLRALAETGNATWAALRARVSRSWAYKRREVDAGFDALCREMMVRFRESPMPPLPNPSPAKGGGAFRHPTEGRGAGTRTRVNRDRAGGWTERREQHFLSVLSVTRHVGFAAAAVGVRPGSAYQRRRARPDFAAAWARTIRDGDPLLEGEWLQAMVCLLDGEPVPQENLVRAPTIDEALRLLARCARSGPSTGSG